MKIVRALLLWWVALCVIWSPIVAFAQVPASFTGPQVIKQANGSYKVFPSMFSMLKDAGVIELGLAAASNGGVNVSQAVKAPVGMVIDVPMSAVRNIPKSAIASGAARLLPTLGLATAAVALFDQVRCSVSPGSSIGGFLKCDNGLPPGTIPWYVNQYDSSNNGVTPTAVVEQKMQLSCSGYYLCVIDSIDKTGANSWLAKWSYKPTTTLPWVQNQITIVGTTKSNYCAEYTDINGKTHPAAAPMPDGKCWGAGFTDTSPDDAGAKITSLPSFGSKAVDLVRESAGKGIDYEPQAGPTTVSGPASVNGPSKTVTRTKADGTTETVTEQTRHNITYGGDSYTYNTTTTTVNNTTGETTTETKDDDVAPPTDPSMPPQPDLYDQKYPDGLAGVWNEAKAGLQSTPIFTFLASLVPSVGDGGCPSWQMPIMTGWKQFSTADISVPCWVWSAVRGIVVCTALLSCRKIIFGG